MEKRNKKNRRKKNFISKETANKYIKRVIVNQDECKIKESTNNLK